jgi:hypothetical protein
MRGLRLLVVSATLAAVTGVLTPLSGVTATQVPRWVKHVQRFPGGISNGVRFSLDPAVIQAQGARRAATGPQAPNAPVGNLQMNTDSNPPLPQNETSVAYSTDDPKVAVAGSNDYISGGTMIMRTADGGRHWATTQVIPVFRPTSDICNGGDPALAYSARDHAFYLSQLCFFRQLPQSEVQVYKSVDNGATWTPGRRAAIPATNYDSTTATVDTAHFNDKEYIAVDNNPSSPWYGRLYVTWTRFHIRDDGFSDTCPIKLAYTDAIPTTDPSTAVWTRRDVVADHPGNGADESANQFSVPVVEKNGTLDVAYILEECNSSLDFGLRFQKSTNGGDTFLPRAVSVNKPGQWQDNPNATDTIPNTSFRTPNTVSMAYSRVTGTLVYIYTNYPRRGNGNIDVSLSHDGGATWSDSKTISTGGGGTPARNNQFFPWIAANPRGRFVAIWFDRREDPANHDIGTFEAWSVDDGATWVDSPISVTLWNPDQGFFASGAFIGDYNGIAAANQVVYPVWTDGRNSAFAQTGIGETDIFTDIEIGTAP